MAGPEARRGPSLAGRILSQRSVRPGDKKKKRKAPTSFKNQIRGVERLLSKPDLDPKLRARQEKKLEELRASQGAHAREELERKYAVRYHKVKFFERVKLERRVRQLGQRVAAPGLDPGVAAELRGQLDRLQEDLQYVLHFPPAEKYVSILQDPEDAADRERVATERARLKALVAAQLTEAALVGEADEGRGLAASLGRLAGGKPGAAAVPRGLARGPAPDAAKVEAGEQTPQGDDDDFFLDDDSDAELAAPVPIPRTAPKRQAPLTAPLPKPRLPKAPRAPRRQQQQEKGKEPATGMGPGRPTRQPERPEARSTAARAPLGPARAPATPKLRIPPQERAAGDPPAPTKRKAPLAPAAPAEPLRKRAEGGRKRRKKKD